MAQAVVADRENSAWSVELGETWDLLGPFPIHAREQHFLSPAFPIDVSEPIDFSATWPSSYADGGRVSWAKAHMNRNGDLKVSFPSVRWEELRSTEGWAALQHHCVLRTTITVSPPLTEHLLTSLPVHLTVRLTQGSFFAVLPTKCATNVCQERFEPEWHAGDIYAMRDTLPSIVNLPVLPSTYGPTTYDLFVSGDYEIRLFGDPHAYGAEIPVLSLNVQIGVEIAEEKLVWEPTQDVVPCFLDGFVFGDALGIGLRSVSGMWTVQDVTLLCDEDNLDVITLTLLRNSRIVSSQTRVIPISISQTHRFMGRQLPLEITAATEATSVTILVTVPIKQTPMWTQHSFSAIKATYFYAESHATAFLAVPPKETNLPGRDPSPPLLALRTLGFSYVSGPYTKLELVVSFPDGAGVEIMHQDFWVDALPRQDRSWIVIPAGRTSWGLDWHGPSAKDAWASLDALASILERSSVWQPWQLRRESRVIILGHSNGGQGALYLASRYPDRTLGVIPAAGYIKSQAYVSWSFARFGHFVDPALRAILETSLTPDDNDLFLSNIVDTPILAIHGGRDGNVPTWHTRETTCVLQTWKADADVRYREDEGQPHWYSPIFKTPDVQSFIDSLIRTESDPPPRLPLRFTLTVAIPAESGSLHGWRIERLQVPGRLGRLHVKDIRGVFHVKTTNVRTFTLPHDFAQTELVLDGAPISVVRNSDGVVRVIAGLHQRTT